MCGPYLIHLSKTINETVSLLGTSSLPQKTFQKELHKVAQAGNIYVINFPLF